MLPFPRIRGLGVEGMWVCAVYLRAPTIQPSGDFEETPGNAKKNLSALQQRSEARPKH